MMTPNTTSPNNTLNKAGKRLVQAVHNFMAMETARPKTFTVAKHKLLENVLDTGLVMSVRETDIENQTTPEPRPIWFPENSLSICPNLSRHEQIQAHNRLKEVKDSVLNLATVLARSFPHLLKTQSLLDNPAVLVVGFAQAVKGQKTFRMNVNPLGGLNPMDAHLQNARGLKPLLERQWEHLSTLETVLSERPERTTCRVHEMHSLHVPDIHIASQLYRVLKYGVL